MHKEEVYLVHDSGDKIFCENFIAERDGENKPVVVVVPGLSSRHSDKYSCVYNDLGAGLATSGFTAVTFSTRGQAGSGGYYSFPNIVEDISLIVSYLKESKITQNNIHLLSRSSGGPPALRFATLPEFKDDIRSLALWGISLKSVYEDIFGDEKREYWLNRMKDGGTVVKEDFLDTLFYPEDIVCNVDNPVLFFLGTEDEFTTPEEQLVLLRETAHSASSLRVIKGAKHAIDKDSDFFENYMQSFTNWFNMFS